MGFGFFAAAAGAFDGEGVAVVEQHSSKRVFLVEFDDLVAAAFAHFGDFGGGEEQQSSGGGDGVQCSAVCFGGLNRQFAVVE